MNEKMLEASFQIISYSGNAKTLAYEAIKDAKLGKFKEARKKLEQSKIEMHNAHEFQMRLIQQEACGEKIELDILSIHAQDHLMNTISYEGLAEEIVDLYERLEENK